METFEGCVEQVIYRNAENGYTVFLLKTAVEITAVGILPEITEGENIRVTGEWTDHAAYGRQFKITDAVFLRPTDKESAERYLSSGVIKGIGPSLAKRIVDRFGDRTFFVMEAHPEELAQVKGISEKKARQIAREILEKRDIREVTMFLQKYGVSANLAVKIYKHFGQETYEVLRKNPYRLADEVYGIGFKTADEIALSQGGAALESEFRIGCGIRYTLQQAAGNGHTCLPYAELIRQSAEVLGVSEEAVEHCMAELLISRKLIIKRRNDVQYVFNELYYHMESHVAKGLMDLDVHDHVDERILNERIDEVEQEEGIHLDEIQREAVCSAFSHGLLILTGGPGTGKTTTLNSIIRMFELEGMEVVLAAPTGRAARRMKEATGHEASTIHRLLELTVGGDPADGISEGRANFARNEQNPLEADAVVIDEASMIDISLMNALVKAIPVGIRLILVGDADQLPSVGPGNVLRDLIESECFPVVKLTRIFRQSEESDIVMNAHAIRAGQSIDVEKKSRDFFFIRRDPEHTVGATITLVRDKLPELLRKDYPGERTSDLISRIQVLSPMKKGPFGVQNLNQVLQQYLNPEDPLKEEVTHGDITFREGDRVMQVRNDYQLEWVVYGKRGVELDRGTGVFNGDCGYITKINTVTEEVTVLYEESRQVRYEFDQMDELDLAYALTIHKSQGSEYPVVVLPLNGGPRMLMNRNLLYTAVTRAKNCVVVVGSPECFLQMIQNVSEVTRYSGLLWQLQDFKALKASMREEF